ncbi:MAG: hypothetical protein WCI11_19975 [Candidatus Methylumidiphilus sp.]
MKKFYKYMCRMMKETVNFLLLFTELVCYPSFPIRNANINCLYSKSDHTQLILILSLLACLSAPSANADLSSTSLESLIEQSDVIVFAQLIKFENDHFGAGYAIFTPKKTIKGELPSESFRITWSDEVHEQRIDTNDSRLLFLKRTTNGGFTGTQYGRSYWIVETPSSKDSACNSFTQYIYPVNMISIDSKYIKAGLFIKHNPHKKSKVTPILCLDDIQSIIR